MVRISVVSQYLARANRDRLGWSDDRTKRAGHIVATTDRAGSLLLSASLQVCDYLSWCVTALFRGPHVASYQVRV